MHHTCAYFLAIANVANTDVPALSDGILAIQNGHFLPPTDMPILQVYAGAASLIRARITSPSLRQITQPQIRPVSLALLPPNNPNVCVYGWNGLRARALEELAVQATDSVGTTENLYVVLNLGTRYAPVVAGDIIWCRGTGTATLTASSWTQCAYTLDDQLPAGTYAMVASELWSTTAVAHRWTFDNQFERPGGLSTALGTSRINKEVYDYRYGEYGRFRNTSLPRLEVLANAADTVETLFMGLVKVG